MKITETKSEMKRDLMSKTFFNSIHKYVDTVIETRITKVLDVDHES